MGQGYGCSFLQVKDPCFEHENSLHAKKKKKRKKGKKEKKNRGNSVYYRQPCLAPCKAGILRHWNALFSMCDVGVIVI